MATMSQEQADALRQAIREGGMILWRDPNDGNRDRVMVRTLTELEARLQSLPPDEPSPVEARVDLLDRDVQMMRQQMASLQAERERSQADLEQARAKLAAAGLRDAVPSEAVSDHELQDADPRTAPSRRSRAK